MANGVVAKRDVIAVGDNGLISLAHGERDEVICLAFKCAGDFGWNGRDHALEIERIDGDLAGRGIADAVRRLGNGREPDDLGGAARDGWGCLRHSTYSTHSGCRRAARRTKMSEDSKVGEWGPL